VLTKVWNTQRGSWSYIEKRREEKRREEKREERDRDDQEEKWGSKGERLI